MGPRALELAVQEDELITCVGFVNKRVQLRLEYGPRRAIPVEAQDSHVEARRRIDDMKQSNRAVSFRWRDFGLARGR